MTIAALLAKPGVQVIVGLAAVAASDKMQLPQRAFSALRVLAGVEAGDKTIVGQGLDLFSSLIPDKNTLNAAKDLTSMALTATSPRYAKTELAKEQLRAQSAAATAEGQTQQSQAKPKPQPDTNTAQEITVSPKTKAVCACTFKTKVPLGSLSGLADLAGVENSEIKVGFVGDADNEPMCDDCRLKAHHQALLDVMGWRPDDEMIASEMLEIGEVTTCTLTPPSPNAAEFNGILGFDDDRFRKAYKKWQTRIDACKQNERKAAAEAAKKAADAQLAAERAAAQKKTDDANARLEQVKKQMENQRRASQEALLRATNAAEQQRLKDQITALQEREKLAAELQAKIATNTVVAQTGQNEVLASSQKQLFDQLAQLAEQRGAPPQWAWGMGNQYTPGMQPPPNAVPPQGYAVAPWGGFVPVDPQQQIQQMQEQAPLYTSLEEAYGLSGVDNEMPLPPPIRPANVDEPQDFCGTCLA